MKKKLFVNVLMAVCAVVFINSMIYRIAFAEAIRWKMASVWPGSFILVNADKKFIEIVNKLSNGRLTIDFAAGGEVVPAFELLDAVSSGVIQGGFDWPGYWAGKNSAFSLLGSFPMLLTAGDYQMWIYQGGGLDAYNEVYGKFNLVYFPHSCQFSESGVRANKPINTLEDYKGLKIRMGGKPQGAILKELGASQVMLSGGEVYQALEKGIVDGAEFAMPSIDKAVGLDEVTKFWCSPGWHQPASPLGIMINKDAWNKLPNDLQELIKYAAMACYNWSTAYFEYGNIGATKEMLDKGIKITRLSDEDLDKIQKIANMVLVEESKKNALFKKVAQSQVKFLRDISQWRSISSPFSYGRNITDFPNLE